MSSSRAPPQRGDDGGAREDRGGGGEDRGACHGQAVTCHSYGRMVLSGAQARRKRCLTSASLPAARGTLASVPAHGQEGGKALPRGPPAAVTLQSPTAEDWAAARVPEGLSLARISLCIPGRARGPKHQLLVEAYDPLPPRGTREMPAPREFGVGRGAEPTRLAGGAGRGAAAAP